jgi:hypothetical protein
MRNSIMAAAAAAAALFSPLAATSASAQDYGYHGGYDPHVQRAVHECHRELRRADSRYEYERDRRECAREISHARREAWRHDRWHDSRYADRGW